ncbi:MAG: hypothetical protein COV74_01470 [Candidatus Omnitrophica bacterium CG11_big_fil_rev_8_21_14_0_20_45_26]|uniref:Sigma-54 factor interaction domain-containing protein n=1 Tax=Candidatus Abzuiibacterium crystallinum TaxID=1974748 RepID=A0A2H0LS50_9BACT|nr:MAG: hypothetical protein COV74_01470 [Candidatus Omnitrophica bacterium CG11_big_fil_rev_8_21_14_0_20_45_26]PIW64967.1 MAG: hypothetical protein COW12_03750 [Candidatus Omnitrophica bacterium CG12_big_fil_rev_8_21_14_0_65_45_16]
MLPKTESKNFGLIGASAAIKKVQTLVNKVAPFDAPVLIEGESGTGKELVAKGIHFSGPRKNKEFVVVNCSAFPDQLLESELFGHMRGSFTGAIAEKKGLFEIADQGTFFLDEVGDMSPALQVKLLRVLQEGIFMKVGGTSSVQVNVRIIAATNKDLKDAVAAKQFREDLYFRLNVMHIKLPPLRQRVEDIPLLVDYISQKIAQRNEQPVKTVSPKALRLLTQYSWPGNVRELENELEKAYVFSDEKMISESCFLHLNSQTGGAQKSEKNLKEKTPRSLKERKKMMVSKLEKSMIEEALREAKGNQTKASKQLGISRQDLIRKIHLYNIS